MYRLAPPFFLRFAGGGTIGAQPQRSYFPALDRLGIDAARIRNVIGLGVVRLARTIGDLLVLGADRTDHVMPAIVPIDASFSARHFPGTVACAQRFSSVTVAIQRDEEVVAGAITNFPFTHEVVAAELKRRAGGEVNAGNISQRQSFFATVVGKDHRLRVFEFYAVDVGVALLMAVLKMMVMELALAFAPEVWVQPTVEARQAMPSNMQFAVRLIISSPDREM